MENWKVGGPKTIEYRTEYRVPVLYSKVFEVRSKYGPLAVEGRVKTLSKFTNNCLEHLPITYLCLLMWKSKYIWKWNALVCNRANQSKQSWPLCPKENNFLIANCTEKPRAHTLVMIDLDMNFQIIIFQHFQLFRSWSNSHALPRISLLWARRATAAKNEITRRYF